MKKRNIFGAVVTAMLCLMLCTGCGKKEDYSEGNLEFDEITQQRLEEMEGEWYLAGEKSPEYIFEKGDDGVYSTVKQYYSLYERYDECDVESFGYAYNNLNWGVAYFLLSSKYDYNQKKIKERKEKGITIDAHTPVTRVHYSTDAWVLVGEKLYLINNSNYIYTLKKTPWSEEESGGGENGALSGSYSYTVNASGDSSAVFSDDSLTVTYTKGSAQKTDTYSYTLSGSTLTVTKDVQGSDSSASLKYEFTVDTSGDAPVLTEVTYGGCMAVFGLTSGTCVTLTK